MKPEYSQSPGPWGGEVSAPIPPPRLLRFSRWGLAEDPIGGHVVIGNALLEVTGTYRREVPNAIMLKVRHLNGDDHHDVAASAVRILERTYESDEPTQ